MMKSNIIRRFISILGSKVVILFIGTLTTPILVRLLGSSQYGDYAFLLSILGTTMIIINAGISNGIRKYVSENREDPNWTEYVFGFYFRLAFVLASVGSLVYMALSWSGLYARFFEDKFAIYILLIGFLIIGRQMNSVARAGLMGLGLEEKSEPISVVKKISFILIALYLVYIGYGIVGVLAGHIVSTVIVSILTYIILFQYIHPKSIFTRVPGGFPKSKLISFNSLSIVLIFLTASLYHVDIVLLRLFKGNQTTGYYKAALVVAEFLWFVPRVLQTLLLQSSSELWSNNRINRITTLASQTTRYNLALVLLLMIGLAALASDFIPIYYGSEFDAAVLPLLLLLPGVLGFALARPIFAIGQGKGQLRILIIATGTASLANLCLNALLIPLYGMAGAAVATSISYSSMCIFHILAAKKIGFNPINDLRLRRITIVAAISAVIIFLISLTIDSSIISLIVVPPVGFIIYSTLCLKLSVVSPGEATIITQRLPSTFKEPVEKMVYLVS